ncbi:DoxX family protein [Stygiobacter electus]|uniref:DoxX family protein n=1 Tax=Stygiobacter electus TaxID=3032292 RepID=A0AAE3P358_9BACT|nr:DoxX family protein [Stygiobacter electus]MDF1613284.1 DoxX family protein [Stygiobacter electus]
MKINRIKYYDAGIFLVRFSMGITFLSAVASRFSLWGDKSSGWDAFLLYAAEVNSFIPDVFVPFLALTATILESVFGILLIIGYKTRWAAFGSAGLTLMFALAMAYSFGFKSPLDYSVFVDSAASFLLFTSPYYKWTIDEKISKRKNAACY